MNWGPPISISTKTVNTSVDHDMVLGDDYIVWDTAVTVKLLLLAEALLTGEPVVLKSKLGIGTIDGNGASVEGGLSVPSTASTKLLPTPGGWLEVA